MSTRRVFRTPLICRICGDSARGLNFDVITCMSCKAFFRRNALRPDGSLQCAYHGDCPINKESRMRCSACRLKKCLIYGMKPELIRSYKSSSNIESDLSHSVVACSSWQSQLPLPQPIGLLQKDRSQMSSEQWTMISSIVHAYDAQNIFTRIQRHLKEQSALPIKLRSKSLPAIHYISETAQALVLFVTKSPQFQSLSFDTRRHLLKNNLYLTNCINRLLINREMDLMNNETFVTLLLSFYGPTVFDTCLSFVKRIDLNGILFKMILLAMIFSSNCSIITTGSSLCNAVDFDVKSVLKIQDLYVTLLWKYLIYQYGHTEAVLRYASLIKTILDMDLVIERMLLHDWYRQMLKKISDDTENLLFHCLHQ